MVDGSDRLRSVTINYQPEKRFAMTPRIERLTLRCFRGATTETSLALDSACPLVVIYGENGTGKSTLLDAIDAVCNGTPGVLGERSLGTRTAAARFLAAAGQDPASLLIELAAGGSTWRVSLERNQLHRTGDGAPPAAHVL